MATPPRSKAMQLPEMPSETQLLRASFLMLGAVLCFTMMAIAGRKVSKVHDTFEIMTARSAIGFVLVMVAGLASGRLREVSTARLSGHFLRNIVHFTGQNLWFLALGLIPLAQVFALEFTAPIWVILLSPLFLNEALTRPRLTAAALGFIGILIVARPDFAALNTGVMAAAGAAVCFAAVQILTKRLTRGESVIGILFWLTLMQFCFGVICIAITGHITWPTGATLPWLGLIGLAGLLAHLCLTTALSLAPASYVVPIDFIRLPLIAVVAALAFAEPLDPMVLIGGAVIFVGIWINVRSQLRQPA